jgi:hypothetical protein
VTTPENRTKGQHRMTTPDDNPDYKPR